VYLQRIGRRWLPAAVLAWALLLAACSSGKATSPPPATDPSTPSMFSTTAAAPAGPAVSFPADATICPPDTSAPPAAQITMVRRQILYGALPDGSSLHCLMDGRGGIDHWSADGRYLFDANGQADSLVAGGQDYGYDVSTVAAAEFSRPSADSSYFQTKAGGILRYDFATQQETTVSDQGGANDLTVSPDGSLLAYGGSLPGAANAQIWTLPSGGGQPKAVATLPGGTSPGMGSAYASYLTFVSNTKLLYLQSSPGSLSGPYTLMSLQLGQAPQSLGQVGPKVDAAVDAGLVAAGGSSPLVAVSYGECTDGITTSVYDTSQSSPTAQAVPVGKQYVYVTPIGWLPDGQLVLLGRTDDCHGSGDVLLWKPGQAAPTVFASGASSAAVRVPGSLQIPAKVTQ
jgi:hypothetical protein